MSLPIPVPEWLGLLRDPDPALRAVAAHMLHERLESVDPQTLCPTLWDLAETDAHEVLLPVVRLLADPRKRVVRFALLAIRSLHPLAGLPVRSGPLPTPSDGAHFMREWLEPRASFAAALAATLRDPRTNPARVAEALSELPGEPAEHERLLGERDPALAGVFARAHAASRAARAPGQLIVALTYRCNRKCPYCYAYESQDEYRDDIAFDAALRALDWAVQQNAQLISFTGGEPTCHPSFAELVREVERRGLGLYLNTNGLFEAEAVTALRSPAIVNVGFHVSERRLHRRGELEVILDNAKRLVDHGTNVFFRHTLWRTGEDDAEWLIETAVALGVRHLNLALGFPGRTATNRYVPAERLEEVKPVYFRVLEHAARRGVRVRSSKPVPLCLFTRAEFARFQRHHEMASICSVHERGGVHNLVVNPDLGSYPCVGLPFPGPSLDDPGGYEPHREHAQREIRRALRVVQSACSHCALHSLGVCQASCLGHCNDRASSRAPSEAS